MRLFSSELNRWLLLLLLLYTYGSGKMSASRAGCTRGDKGRGDRVKEQRAGGVWWPS
jgi:hypothetical protein